MSCATLPRCGFHSLRIPWIDLAFWDVFGTILVAAGLAFWFKKSFFIILIALVFLGIFVHWLLRIPTQLNQYMHVPN